jgi:uncharacterized membrane protein YdjX (TVP38/TMEM64 family)
MLSVQPVGKPSAEPLGEPSARPTWMLSARRPGKLSAPPAGQPSGRPTRMLSARRPGKLSAPPAGQPSGRPTWMLSARRPGKLSAPPAGEPSVEPVGGAELPRCDRRRAGRRFLILLACIGILAGLAFLAPLPSLHDVPRLAGQLGPAGPILAVLGGALLLIAMVPRTAITLATGALFGPVSGTGYALCAALLGALIAFALGRLLGRDFVADRVRGRLARLDSWFERQTVLGVITVRLLPIGGFGLVSYGYGTTGARLRPYLIGTTLASVPSTVGYAVVGAAAVAPHGMNWLGFTPSLLGVVATAIVVGQWRLARRRARTAATRTPRQRPAALTAA